VTPHNEAKRGDYAETVLLPGDPVRAAWIASSFLEDARIVNGLRGESGYTGTFHGVPVSIQSTGMGAPSMAIYAYELLDTYRARTLIRIGSCGALSEQVKLRSLIASQSASADSSINRQIFGPFDYAPSADFGLLKLAEDRAAALKVPLAIGPTASSDIFYHPDVSARYQTLRQHGALAVDMETAALYTIAARFSARALSICTVVDNLVTGEETAEHERQAVFADMVALALDVVAALPASK